MTPTLILIAAVARDGIIGNDNALPWHLPEDLKHFKELTTGHAVIMGRKTWESLPERFRPLPGRHNLVVTRNAAYAAPGATVVHSLAEARQKVGAGSTANPTDTAPVAFVIGGAELYAHALPLADRLELTEIDAAFPGDTHFPAVDPALWRETARLPQRAAAGFDFAYVTYTRTYPHTCSA
jgi:dihydrofolate reductase